MVSTLLNIKNILIEIKLHFVVTIENELDTLRIETDETSILKAMSYVIYQWLHVLIMASPIMYSNIVEISLYYKNIKTLIKKLNNDSLLEAIISTKNEQEGNIGDDISSVRTKTIDEILTTDNLKNQSYKN